MSVLSPLALLGLLFVPAVLAMYLLKLRRDEQVVPSTLLWHRLVADVEANAPWQRLRRSALLLLQLLLVLLLAALAARPFLERPAGLAGDLVIVIDTSASMAASDVTPSRLEAAKAQAIAALRDLPADGQVSVIAAGRTARVVVNGTSDLGRVRAAIDAITVSPATGNLGDALNLANALAARSGDAEILVASDAALAAPPTTPVDHPVKALLVGRGRANQAIVALAVRPAPSGVTRSVFVSVANLDIEKATRRVELYGDGVLLEARDVFLEPQARTEVIVDDVPGSVSVVEVRLTVASGTAGATGDALALDDRAWTVVPPDRKSNILIVGEGDPYLETALTFLPNVNLFGVKPANYPKDAVRTDGTAWDLIVFEGNVPAELPGTPTLLIAPPQSSDLAEVVGTLTDPGIGTPPADEPILRYVDLSTTHIGKAAKLVLPAWARPVLPGPGGSPLLYVGDRDGQRAGVLAFEPRQSDLPLQVGFPILIANLTGELLGGSSTPTTAVVPGDPVTLPLPPGATGLSVEKPDGSTVIVPAVGPGAASVSFSQTDELGVYEATPIGPTPSAGASPVGSPSSPPAGPSDPIRFAVDLFDPAESNIAPGTAGDIEAIGPETSLNPRPTAEGLHSPAPSVGPGETAPPSAGPTGSPAAGGVVTSDRRPARDELWIPVVLVALLVLAIEWLVYHRDAVTRLWRSLRRREPAPESRSR